MSTLGVDVAERPDVERDRLVAELALESEQLRALLDVAPAAVATTGGPEHVIRSANLALRRLAGADVVGKPARAVLADAIGENLLQRMDDAYASGDPFSGTELVLGAPSFPAGDETFWDVTIRPLRAPHGAVIGLLLQLLEVTERVRARADADTSRRASSRLLAELFHEFRTPLSAIIGYAELLERSLPAVASPTDLQYLNRIATTAWHMNGLAENVLTFARAEAGRLEVRPAWVDAVAEIAVVAAMLEGEAAVKGIRLSVASPHDTLPVETDAGKLRQILVNVVGNAVKFTDEGQVSVTSERVGDELLVRVADTGPGIEPRHQEAIFELFGRPGEPTPVKAGAGIGLPLSRQLAGVLGGGLELESVPGSGSTFTLRLPLRGPGAPPPPA